jgi:hypothetical protein
VSLRVVRSRHAEQVTHPISDPLALPSHAARR